MKDDHLRVLWGEIGRLIRTSRYPLDSKYGGPLIVNHREIKKKINGVRDDFQYLIGTVSDDEAGMAGHHAKYTLVIGDEASGLDNKVYRAAQGWAKRQLWIGNPNPCNNWWREAIKAGNLLPDPNLARVL